jgi:acyl carrier protein
MSYEGVPVAADLDRNVEVFNFIRARIADRTDHKEDEVAAESVLIDLGLQSIDAVLVCGEIEDHFGIELDPAMIFEHETMGSFTKAVSSLVAKG